MEGIELIEQSCFISCPLLTSYIYIVPSLGSLCLCVSVCMCVCVTVCVFACHYFNDLNLVNSRTFVTNRNNCDDYHLYNYAYITQLVWYFVV